MVDDIPQLHDAIGLLQEFLNSLGYIINIMRPEAHAYLDQYCTGLMFGHQGSKMLVRFANLLFNPRDANGDPIPLNISKEERERRMAGTKTLPEIAKSMWSDFRGLTKTIFEGDGNWREQAARAADNMRNAEDL